MSVENLGYFLALMANVTFAGASLIFAVYSQRVSASWMNAFKAFISWLVVFIPFVVLGGLQKTTPSALWPFMLSGFIGLCIGDYFLLSAFARMGPARTLTLFGFQPLIVAAIGSFFFHQDFGWYRFIAIFFMILCLCLFSLEAYKKTRQWELRGLFFAMSGMLLDTVGVFLTRWTFDHHPTLTPLEGHFLRCSGAVAGFIIIGMLRPTHLFREFWKLPTKGRWTVSMAAVLGTVIALVLYMWALQIGHLASITAIAITGPLFATIIESMYFKRRPSWYLLWATVSFVIGFLLMLKESPLT
jgi:drug/metabolite transporter (DMT)-like permease